MKKKLLSLALLTMLSVSVIACGGNQSEEEVVQFGVGSSSFMEENGIIPWEDFQTYIGEEIVLTTENASEYLEVVIEQEKDDFGEPKESYNYYVKLKEGYYAYTSDIIVRYEWEEGTQYYYDDGDKVGQVITNENDVTIHQTSRSAWLWHTYEYDEDVFAGNYIKVAGTVYSMSIPDECWKDEEGVSSIYLEYEDENGNIMILE